MATSFGYLPSHTYFRILIHFIIDPRERGAVETSCFFQWPAGTKLVTQFRLHCSYLCWIIVRVILARFEQFVAAHHCTKKIFFWSICLLLHYNQPPIIGTMPIRDIGELPYPHLLCWRAMKVNRSHSVRTNSIFAINSSIVSQNYFNGSHLSPNNTRTCHQLICVDFVTKCRS